jgi:hypothetical protein
MCDFEPGNCLLNFFAPGISICLSFLKFPATTSKCVCVCECVLICVYKQCEAFLKSFLGTNVMSSRQFNFCVCVLCLCICLCLCVCLLVSTCVRVQTAVNNCYYLLKLFYNKFVISC